MIVINCATNSTLQELKTSKSSGVFTYDGSDDFQSVTSNRYIVWRTCDDMLELSEHSLNRNLIDAVLKIQFKNTLILPNGVSIHETPDKIYVLVTTLVSAHRLAFNHPNKLFPNPTGVSSAISFINTTTTSPTPTTDPLVYSIFHNVPAEVLHSAGNYCQLPNSTVQNTMLSPASPFPFLASCSWINSHLEAYFVVSKNTGSLHVIKLPSLVDANHGAEPKVHTIDLKQNSLIGMTMKRLSGFVSSLKSTSNGAEAAISLLSHSTPDDDLIFALCRDFNIRVLSLKKQECIIVHNLLQNQQQMQAQFHSPSTSLGSASSQAGFNLGQQNRQPVSIKLWWPGDDTNTPLPNLVVYLSGAKYKSFYFFETVIRQRASTSQVHQSQAVSMNSSFSATHTVANQTTPHLKFLLEVIAPVEQNLIDYFVADNQIWALMQHNDTFSLQYYTIDSPNCPAQIQKRIHPPLEWIPVMADVNVMPEMEVRSSLCNSREYYLKEIFWRGHFSLSTIAKAISVSNLIAIEDEKINPANVKIDQLVKEANNLVDGMIRTQINENQQEFSMEEYTKLELDAWQRLYSFCLGYHAEENKPLSIFVDYKTGAKGIVRQGKIEFIPALEPFDELIEYYFLLCKEMSGLTDLTGGTLDSNHVGSDNPINLFSEHALDYRINTLIADFEEQTSSVFASTLQQSIREILFGMSMLSKSLSEEALREFSIFMSRMSSCIGKDSLKLADIAKMFTEDSVLPEMNLSDNAGQEIDDFFNRCPMAVEAIKILINHIKFSFSTNPNDKFDIDSDQLPGSENLAWKMHDALQYEIKPIFSSLLTSGGGLEFVAESVRKIIDMRYKFCRDLFLFQYHLNRYRSNLRTENMLKIAQIETVTIPSTTQQLYALDYLSWASQTPMINPNIWWNPSDASSENGSGVTSIVNANTSPPKNTLKSSIGNTSSLENSELLSVLEMREYINLNRIGILSHESTFYDAYPHSTVLHFFIQFSGGILAKRLLSYKLVVQHDDDLTLAINNIWGMIVSNYLTTIGELLWPQSAGQFKLAEFLLGVAQYDLLERYNQRLHWCMEHSYSRFFLKGICSLVAGDGHKAIRHLKQAIFGINSEPFLFKIFAKKAKNVPDSQMNEGGDGPANKTTKTIPRGNEDSGVLPNSRTIFRYYNKLIQLFKRYSSPDFVIELVEVAITMLNREKDPEFKEHHSSLQSTLFACHLRLNNVKPAYHAMIDNLDPDQRKICLRQFILHLCETGQFHAFIEFNYCELEDDFVSILESKARTSSARFHPGKHLQAFDNYSTTSRLSRASTADSEASSKTPVNYYHILYSHFVRVNNFRKAAQTMYDYYRKLNQEASTYATNDSIDLLQKQAEALLMARNCLKLVEDSNESFVIKNAPRRSSAVSDPTEHPQQILKRKRGVFTDQNQNEKTMTDAKVDAEELLCEFELVSARLRLLQRNLKEYAYASTNLSPEETVILCIGACLYEQAFRISTLFKLPLESIFDGMTSKYVQLLNGAYNRRRIDDDMVLTLFDAEEDMGGNPFSNGGPSASPNSGMHSCAIDLLDIFYENGSNAAKSAFISYSSLSICDRMWHLIMHYLTRYETNPKCSTRLMKTVAEKLLSNGVMLPTALVIVYQKVNCPELLRLLMTYNFLPEATQLSIQYIKAFLGHGTEYFDMKHQLYARCPPLCIPMHIFECLLKILREESEESKLEQWQNRLASDDTANSIASVDDYANEEKIDYEELYKNLSKMCKDLQAKIVACSS